MNTMKKQILLAILLLLVISSKSVGQFQLKEGYLSMLPKDRAEGAFKFKNLILYPILGGSKFLHETNKSNYLSLEEALKQKKVIITEKEGTGGEVNSLYIENVSKDTVFIMAGEVIKGGKQDRVISDDRVLEPNNGKIDLSVFCVEQNRWTYRSDRNFSQYHSLSSNSVRKSAVKDKNQGDVWQKVSEVTDKQNAKTSTGTYTSLSNSDAFTKELSAYLAFYSASFGKFNNCVGFVGVSGDKIIGCDIFANTDLFKKQLRGLLQSYCTEAISNGKPALPSFTKVNTYLSDYLSDEKEQDEKIEKVGTKYEYKGKKMHINTY
jgi:hypothetical protein